MTHDRTPCPQREGGLPCVRSRLAPVCVTCRRELPMTHPTTIEQAQQLFDLHVEPDIDAKLAAVRRINRALQADQDRALGIDTSKPPRPLVDRLPGLQAQLAARHDLPMRVVADLLDEVVLMLELLAAVRAVIDRTLADRTALAAIDGWAEVRDLIYPDTDVARHLNERRRMTPAEHEAERAAADAAECEAWAGIRTDDE